ncbi:MAG: hypothetical protein LBP88_01035 [Treponema sp.]|jgi:hypothetical protein|nr:hypothetical protein [Treponema sp.]
MLQGSDGDPLSGEIRGAAQVRLKSNVFLLFPAPPDSTFEQGKAFRLGVAV